MGFGCSSGLNKNGLHIFDCLVTREWHHMAGIRKYDLAGGNMSLLGGL